MEATKCQPNANAMTVITIIKKTCKPTLSVLTNQIINKNEITKAAKLSLWRLGNIIGLDDILPLSLP